MDTYSYTYIQVHIHTDTHTHAHYTQTYKHTCCESSCICRLVHEDIHTHTYTSINSSKYNISAVLLYIIAMAVLGIALIAMGEDIGGDMSFRALGHLVSICD